MCTGSLIRHSYREFSNFRLLKQAKQDRNITIAFVIPTLNEAKTIGNIVSVLLNEKDSGIIDEVIVVDSDSTDDTVAIAKRAGASVFKSSDIKSSDNNHYIGKGENLWKSLHITQCDAVFWVDGDIHDFSNRFVHGLIGPLLLNSDISFVKSKYRRPLVDEKKEVENGGGRLTELLVKPLLSVHFPELLSFSQPLSGEYGGFREKLLQLDYHIGYGVEIGILIDYYFTFGRDSMAEVDMGVRIHRNRSLKELSEMAKEILPVYLRRCVKYDRVPNTESVIERTPLVK